MTTHIDLTNAAYREAAAEILLRHDSDNAEANITSAIRNFLTQTGLAKAEEIVEENPPSDGSRRAVDLTALDTFIEVKRRIGANAGFDPDPANVQQLDDYLELSKSDGKGIRTGILTDGKHWLLRWPEAGPVRTSRPYGFVLESSDQWNLLREWLRDSALISLESIPADRSSVEQYLGPGSPTYQRDIDVLANLYDQAAQYETVRVKRRLWENLLRAALGEIARDPAELDHLFIRHTYLSLVIGMAVQASFGIDLRQLAEIDPSDLLQGRRFRDATGLSGIIESDFFAWPDEVGGHDLLKALARRVARFDWQNAPPDIAAILYEAVIPPDERRTLGEYYTPAWLARAMVTELVDDPLQQRVLDPACGSGTFIAEAVRHFLEAAGVFRMDAPDERDNEANPSFLRRQESIGPRTNDGLDSRVRGNDGSRNDELNGPAGGWLEPKELLDRLRVAVTGIDVHPVAVHLARAAWALAARPAIEAAVRAGYDASGSVPVYLGDALQLRFNAGDLFAGQQVTIQVDDDANSELIFPISLVDRADTFDSLMSQVAADIEAGDDPMLALDDHGVDDPAERNTLAATIAVLKRLHDEGRNHIWAYYARNLVRPVALARTKVDVIIGNPPWLNYNQTADILREELERQSKSLYGIWQGRQYATHQDVAGLFFARSVDLYLKDGGKIGMVLPHSALQTGQYAKWRTGKWEQRGLTPKGNLSKTVNRTLAVDFGYKTAWDLERLEPNTFFPIASCVAFARRTGENAEATPLEGSVERWQGKTGAEDVQRVSSGITDTGASGGSLYGSYARQGAVMVPRCLFFVNETASTAVVQAAQTVTVNPRRGSQDKAPWKDIELTAITGQTVERRHFFNVHLGETVAPYVTLEPLKAILPLKQGDYAIPTDAGGLGGVHLAGLERRMRGRWRIVSQLWEGNRATATKLNLLGQLDYMGKLSSQLEWQKNQGDRPIRIVYTQSGAPTAAFIDSASIVDRKLYWVTCQNVQEAHYLLAIINSDTLATAVNQFTTPNWAGNTRDLEKHLWKLPIPEFDAENALHARVSDAGAEAAAAAAERLEQLRADRGDKLTVTIARRELRKWLRESPEGAAVEEAVKDLLVGATAS